MAARLEVIEKLREAVKDLEKEKRDTLRRYNEQVRSFGWSLLLPNRPTNEVDFFLDNNF